MGFSGDRRIAKTPPLLALDAGGSDGDWLVAGSVVQAWEETERSPSARCCHLLSSSTSIPRHRGISRTEFVSGRSWNVGGDPRLGARWRFWETGRMPDCEQAKTRQGVRGESEGEVE